MKINICYKGIAESAVFDDTIAARVLSETGILSNWQLEQDKLGLGTHRDNVDSQSALSMSALDAHVNSYATVRLKTPYISLSAGCYEYKGTTVRPHPHSAETTAERFATGNGRCAGYVFKCWVVTSLKPAPELPYLAEDVTNLSIYQDFFKFYTQGEITAKLVVPRRQIESVYKIDASRTRLAIAGLATTSAVFLYLNSDFKDPHDLSNLMGAL